MGPQRSRFERGGNVSSSRVWRVLAGSRLEEAVGRGLREGTVAEVVRVTLEETPEDGSTHWTTRSLAQRFGIGKDTVARIWRNHNLKPWQVETFKISKDPGFEEKLVDVAGLYMDPPERVVVFSFGRGNPSPGARPYPAQASLEAGTGRNDDP